MAKNNKKIVLKKYFYFNYSFINILNNSGWYGAVPTTEYIKLELYNINIPRFLLMLSIAEMASILVCSLLVRLAKFE